MRFFISRNWTDWPSPPLGRHFTSSVGQVLDICLTSLISICHFTPGAHLYALNRPGSLEVLLAVAIRRKVVLFAWRVTPLWSYNGSIDVPVGFELERVRLSH